MFASLFTGLAHRPGLAEGRRQVMDPRQRLPEATHGLGQPVQGGVEPEHAAVPFNARFVHDAFEHPSSRTLQARIDVVVVADVHEGVAAVRQAHSARSGFRQMDRKSVSVGKLEVRSQQQCAVGALRQSRFGAEPPAEKPLQCVLVKCRSLEHRACGTRFPSMPARTLGLNPVITIRRPALDRLGLLGLSDLGQTRGGCPIGSPIPS